MTDMNDDIRAEDGADALTVLRQAEKGAKNQYEDADLAQVGKITDWREAFRSFGYKPSSTRSSVEALLRRAVKEKPLPDINSLVNLNNSIFNNRCCK